MTTTVSALVVALVGLCVGTSLNALVARQVAGEPTVPRPTFTPPLAGTLRARDWVGLAVELITATMAVVLWLRYGLSVRALFLFAASLVLIDTGAVDFRIRMIDTLVMVVATLVAVALAPLNTVTWLNALLGTVVATILFLFLFGLAKVLFPGHAAPFGLGDVYLAALIGALAGLIGLPRALFYGIFMAGMVALGLIIARAFGKQVPAYIAYGSYLCLGALVYLATLDQ